MRSSDGVSIIVIKHNEALLTGRLLRSFFETNTYRPIEFIIIDLSSMDSMEDVLGRYATQTFIRTIQCNRNLSIAAANNIAVQKARYPFLLFLSDKTVFTSNMLYHALESLAYPSMGSVGHCSDAELREKFSEKNHFFHYMNFSDDFLLCRKTDFISVGGFGEDGVSGPAAHLYLDLLDRFDRNKTIFNEYTVQFEKTFTGLRVLFVLPQPMDSNCGYHVDRLASALRSLGAECIAAVPQLVHSVSSGINSRGGGFQPTLRANTYQEILRNGISFSDGNGPNIIHAWTPREGVRRFVAALTDTCPCPVVIHLEDNEEYLTEIAVDRHFSDLQQLSLKELDNIVPGNRYHPVHGRKWLEKVHGLTMIIGTLEKFNYGRVPALTILPPVDERLFYPRPINRELRNSLQIPEDHFVLVYSGNVHAGNRDEVSILYRAVQLLNQRGRPTTLIRTGLDVMPLTADIEPGVERFEKSLGWVGREDLPDIMAAADIFVQPGASGLFNDYRIPCKLPEYFAMGRPVILPRTNLGLTVEHGRNAFVLNDATAEGIVGAVIKIGTDKELATKLADGAVDFYLYRIADAAFGQRLGDFYLQILSRISVSSAPATRTVPASGHPSEKKGLSDSGINSAHHANAKGKPFVLPNAFPIESHWWSEMIQTIQKSLGSEMQVISCFDTAITADLLPNESPWVAFVHALPLQDHLDWLRHLVPYRPYFNRDIFNTPAWKHAQRTCRGLMVFSSEQANRLKLLTDVPVAVFHHPQPVAMQKWSWKRFESNASKKIIQIGWWLQRVHAIHALPVKGIEKMWIRLADPRLDEIQLTEHKHLNHRHILFDSMMNAVKIVGEMDSDEYERLLSENILFAHYYDANSLSLVMECIARHTPILINAHSAFREYLGVDYPLYYYFYKDAAEKAMNWELLNKAHEHLRKISTHIACDAGKLVEHIRRFTGENLK